MASGIQPCKWALQGSESQNLLVTDSPNQYSLISGIPQLTYFIVFGKKALNNKDKQFSVFWKFQIIQMWIIQSLCPPATHILFTGVKEANLFCRFLTFFSENIQLK